MDSLANLLARSRRLHPSAGRLFVAQASLKSRSAATAQPAAAPAMQALGEPAEGPHETHQAAPAAPLASSPPPKLREKRASAVVLGTEKVDGEQQLFAWRPSGEPNAFLMITGGSGSGKTELLRVVGADLAGQGVPVLVLDLHGDLGKLPGVVRRQLGAALGINPLGSAGGGATGRSLLALLAQAAPDLGHVQQSLLRQSLQELAAARSGGRAPRLGDLKRALERMQDGPDRAAARGLLHALDAVFDEPVFSASAELEASALLSGSHSLDLSGLSRPAQVVAAGAILGQLFDRLYSAGPVSRAGALRLFVVLDEAAPLRNQPLVEQLAKEARKFGIGLALATQEIRDVPPSLKSNASSAAVFRVMSLGEARQAAGLLPGIEAATLQTLAAPGGAIFRDGRGLHRIQVRPLRRSKR